MSSIKSPWHGGCGRGIIFHTGAILTLPLYVLIRSFLNNNFIQSASPSLLALTAAFWIYFITQYSYRFFVHPLRGLPSPPGSILLGNLPFDGGRPPTRNVARVLDTVPNDGLIAFWTPLYTSVMLFPTKPETFMEILNTHNYDWQKPERGRKFLERTLGRGLVNAEGNEHKSMRKSVAPAFSGKHIRELVSLFYSKGIAFTDAIGRDAQQSNGVIEISSKLHHVTLDIIGAAGVGEDFNTIENSGHPLAQKYAEITRTDRRFPLLILAVRLLVPEWIAKNLKGTPFPAISKAQIELRRDARTLMQDKKRTPYDDHKDIIAIIMRSGEFSDDYLVSQLLTFLAAGHDTTASALTWTIWLLCVNPKMQDRLRQECTTHLADRDATTIDPAVFDADTMPYLTAICNETLRLYPTVPATERTAVVETRIGELRVPKGTSALLSMWAINRSRALWGEDANEFKPDRWIDGPNAAYGGAKSSTTLLTFLHGPRSCIGQAFARMEMKCVLAALMLKFRFEMADPLEKVQMAGFITLKPKNGLKIRLHSLKRARE